MRIPALLIHLIIWFFLLSGGRGSMAAEGELRLPITRVAEIRALSREEAAKALPVKISGVCVSGYGPDFVISDGDQSIFVTGVVAGELGMLDVKRDIPPLQPGSALELEGVTSPGGYAPIIFPSRIRCVGTKPVPPPRRVSMEELLSGSADGQNIEVEGVMQTIGSDGGQIWGTLMVGGSPCAVSFGGDMQWVSPMDWIDARVRLSGLFAPYFNQRSEMVGPKIYVDGKAHVEVLVPPPKDPFQAPRVTLDHLMRFSPDSGRWHRKVTSGTVTFALPGEFFFLQDGSIGVRVASEQKDVKVGDRVDVAGFVDSRTVLASLMGAMVRPIGRAELPAPIPVTVNRILDHASLPDWSQEKINDLSGRTVRLRGEIRRIDWKTPQIPQTVWIESDGRMFPAHLPNSTALNPNQLTQWIPKSVVDVTGICELEYGNQVNPTGLFPAVGFHLWLSSPNKLDIVKSPPWWTPTRLYTAIATVVTLLFLVLCWTWLLRRRVKAQTEIIRSQVMQVAIQEERSRIARDLHDEIGANLTHISILTSLAATGTVQVEERQEIETQAGSLARKTMRAFDQILWSINPDNDTLRSLCHYLCRYAEETLGQAGIELQLELDEAYSELPLHPQIRHQLLLAVKEALHNIVKHAGASRVQMTCHVDSDSGLAITIADNGGGFEIDAISGNSSGRPCLGLSNLRRRLDGMGGSTTISSQTGRGTEVSFLLPLTSLPCPPDH